MWWIFPTWCWKIPKCFYISISRDFLKPVFQSNSKFQTSQGERILNFSKNTLSVIEEINFILCLKVCNFPKFPKNVDYFPNSKGPRSCPKKCCDSPEPSFFLLYKINTINTLHFDSWPQNHHSLHHLSIDLWTVHWSIVGYRTVQSVNAHMCVYYAQKFHLTPWKKFSASKWL